MIYAIIGDCGSGKTLLMAILAYNDFKHRKQPIYSNVAFNFKYNQLTSEFFRNYAEFPIYKATVCMDELSMYYSARKSMSKQNMQLSPFVLQTRKRTLKLFYTAQQWGLCDLHIRDNTDGTYIPEMYVSRHGLPYIKKPEDWEHQEGDTYILKYYYLDKMGDLKKSGVLIAIERFFNLYDTNQIITFEEEKKNDRPIKRARQEDHTIQEHGKGDGTTPETSL